MFECGRYIFAFLILHSLGKGRGPSLVKIEFILPEDAFCYICSCGFREKYIVLKILDDTTTQFEVEVELQRLTQRVLDLEDQATASQEREIEAVRELQQEDLRTSHHRSVSRITAGEATHVSSSLRLGNYSRSSYARLTIAPSRTAEEHVSESAVPDTTVPKPAGLKVSSHKTPDFYPAIPLAISLVPHSIGFSLILSPFLLSFPFLVSIPFHGIESRGCDNWIKSQGPETVG